MWPFPIGADDRFSVEIYLKSGNVIKLPKGYLNYITIHKDGAGIMNQLSWESGDIGKLMRIDLDSIEGIVTRK